ncbi:VOC family protein [Anaerolentibacter hominis]|uniref:VOC family protein n=1 Tax=Anaerolentibacter hominis TaxID=3079009 RepID=UPI0031B83593
MIKGRKLDHIGLAVTDVETTAKWYQDVLGFTVKGKFVGGGGNNVYFLQNGDTVYEMYQPGSGLIPEVQGKIDHISYVSDDIESDYKYCMDQGYEVCTNGIEEIPQFWEKGCRYFKILSPTKEQIEFCQIL